jgi:hypothetical protein
MPSMPDQKPTLEYAGPHQNVRPPREFLIGMFIGLVIVATAFVLMLMGRI